MSQHDSIAKEGVIAGLLAYSMWGLLPIYFKMTASIVATEVLAHRIIWAVPFGVLIIIYRRQWPDVWHALTHKKTLPWLALAAICIAANWLIYVWAVQNEQIFETSLGYYINPLMYMLVGVFFFGDDLRRLQLVAVILAGIGVAVLTISGGKLPWVSLSLAVLFTAYGVIRKRVDVGAMPGLFVEALLLLPMALAWLIWMMANSQASFGQVDAGMTSLIILSGPLTVVPLLFFAIAARRLRLTTLGFLQFLAPTLQLGVGYYYGEQLSNAHIICFACIWAAVLFFSVDAVRASRKPLLEKPAGA